MLQLSGALMTRMRLKIHDLCIVALVATLAGCASAPPPIQLMDRAQAEIRAARDAGATTTAPDVLAEAERRMAAAQQFSVQNDNGKATAKAEEAEAAAETARMRAQVAKLNAKIQQQTQVNAGLQADLERRQAEAAAAQQAAMKPPPPPAPATSAGMPASGSSTLGNLNLAAPAPASSSAAPAPAHVNNGPVTLPSIQLGAPESSGAPASGSTSGVNP